MTSKEAQINNIIRSHSETLASLLEQCAKHAVTKQETMHLDDARRKYRLCPIEERFMKTREIIWDIRNQIMTENIAELEKLDYSKYADNKEEADIIEEIVGILSVKYKTLTVAEKKEYWGLMKQLLKNVVQYQKLMITK